MCLERIRLWAYATFFDKEQREKQEEIERLKKDIKDLQDIIRAKIRMCDHLENGIKQRKLAYDDLASRYQNALTKLSEYIEKYE